MGMLGKAAQLRPRVCMKKDPFPLMLLQLSETLVVWFFFFSQGQPKEAAVLIKMFLIWCAQSVLELTSCLHLHQQCDIAYTNLILPCLGDESNL